MVNRSARSRLEFERRTPEAKVNTKEEARSEWF